MEDNQEAWEDLANAIILTAVEDYQSELIHFIRNPDSKAAKKSVLLAERFFYSDWFDTLTDLDGPTLLRKIKKKIYDKEGQPEGD